MPTNFPEYSKISPTAKMVAYWRQFSDVPFAQEVADLVHAKEVFEDIFKDSKNAIAQTSWFAPMIEARYKSMVQAIRQRKIKQVLELASGVSLRGLAMTSSDPEMVYVETDLPGMSQEKTAVVKTIRNLRKIPEGKNLHFFEVNVMERSQLDQATSVFKNSPIAIIHEGLFQYLSMEEKKTVATHFHSILSQFGGIWMTPDFTTQEEFDRNWNHTASMEDMTDRVNHLTQRDFRKAAFESDDHIQSFFDELGFRIQKVPQLDKSFELISVKNLNLQETSLGPLMEDLYIWILSAK